MGKNKLRLDNECQNCGHTVEVAYCSKCGQKNTETRQSFGHLFTHFIEDLTHYDSGFWKTIKYLLLRPARLTREYLEGHRQRYVAPVKLYIFISFVTFFLPAVLPDFSEESNNDIAATQKAIELEEEERKNQKITFNLNEKEYLNLYVDNNAIMSPVKYRSVKEMDSIENLKPEIYRLTSFEYRIARRMIGLYEKNTPQEITYRFLYSLSNNFPKALFAYLPVFAFWLWVFHSKKRWYFFDHGIFTLHYFSFLLLSVCIMLILNTLYDILHYDIMDWIFGLYFFSVFIYTIYYFYRAHRKMYGEGWLVNFIKSSILFIINIISMSIVMLLFSLITLFTIH